MGRVFDIRPAEPGPTLLLFSGSLLGLFTRPDDGGGLRRSTFGLELFDCAGVVDGSGGSGWPIRSGDRDGLRGGSLTPLLWCGGGDISSGLLCDDIAGDGCTRFAAKPADGCRWEGALLPK